MWATVHLNKDEDDFKRKRRSATSNFVITKSMDSMSKWIGQIIGEIIRCWLTELSLNFAQLRL